MRAAISAVGLVVEQQVDTALATLVTRPRLNLIRFHGVLAPNAKLRAKIIPEEQKSKSSDANNYEPKLQNLVRNSWTRLLKRVFDIDMEHCPD